MLKKLRLVRVNLSFITPASPLILGQFAISCWAFSPWMWDKFGSIVWNFFNFQTFPQTFHNSNLSDPVSSREQFLPRGFVNKFLNWGRRNDCCTDFSEAAHTRAEFLMWLALWLDDLFFLLGSSWEPNLSSWMEEKENCTPCAKNSWMHLFLYYLGVVSIPCIEETDGRTWMQTHPGLVVHCV